MSDNRNQIFIDTDDFEEQESILEEERKKEHQKRKNIVSTCLLFVAIILIIIIAYIVFYLYREYGSYTPDKPNEKCKYVNINDEAYGSVKINIPKKKKSCVPYYNVDYFQNGKMLFNIDLFGDKTKLFNQINQMKNGICVLNCDSDKDGWPDYNIDLNGDGMADINIIKDYKNKQTCDLNCDINHDMLPDLNIDTDSDGKADVNITNSDDNKPYYNIDYKGNREPVFNVLDNNGNVVNPINQKDENGKCIRNCDLDNDGFPDYNIVLSDNNEVVLNELISTGDEQIIITTGKDIDYKCRINQNCKSDIISGGNAYINIDVDGDGEPDVNISNDGGNTITNEINTATEIAGQEVILNEEADGDGFPDNNIDLDGDGKPDLNITDENSKCIKNCDYNLDGKPDDKIEIGDQIISFKDVNIDVDYDGICDVNCDIDYDGIPDINIDITGDRVPDINIDYDGDNKADYNIDVDLDGKPDKNIDVYGMGECNFNCDNGSNVVDTSTYCVRNCDTNGDGLPDKDVDVNNDGICDFNCSTGESKDDKDNNYYLDSEYNNESNILKIDRAKDGDVFIYNPLEIVSYDIEPGWEDNYVMKITNDSDYVVAYRISWKKVYNDFTEINNLDYLVNRNNAKYLSDLKAPYKDIILKDLILIKPHVTVKYTLKVSFKETNINQNIDSGKTFKGQFYIDIIK